jgi:protein phosphatase
LNEYRDVRDETSPPYDMVGDVHGCIDELHELLEALGYVRDATGGVWHPDDRTLIFLGDLADRGPGNMAVWRLVLATDRAILECPPFLMLDDERLVVVHAGLEEGMIGEVSPESRRFAIYGDATGERTRLGLPIRRDWAQNYRGSALIVYGHTPVYRAEFRNNTINIDQGCAFGGALTALRYPELEIVSVPARQVYALPSMRDRWEDRDPTALPAALD